MKPFEYDIENIRILTFEMLDLVKDQIHLTKEALLTSDPELSGEIMRKEKRVNSYEISIDREIEDFLALQAPVASDLRFAMAVLKISSSLERIGDHAYRISSYVFEDDFKITKDIVEILHIPTMFDEIDDMLINITDAFESGDIQLAKRVFKQDKFLNKINKKLPSIVQDYQKKSKKTDVEYLIYLSRIVGKLERCGDMIKNIAEEIIFYYESKVIKHRKKNKQITRKLEKSENN
ncbi:MAG: phosphate signaling complex protein PhoU [Bacteroidales bacterium]|nr:phosphate signaling complex protein PhoU [Bacteroidales bacterium]MBN2819476.1 phosphate signaling complex protein PhoU [Bacteroidales bacterium]